MSENIKSAAAQSVSVLPYITILKSHNIICFFVDFCYKPNNSENLELIKSLWNWEEDKSMSENINRIICFCWDHEAVIEDHGLIKLKPQ